MILHVDLFLRRNLRRHAVRAVLCGLAASLLFFPGCAGGRSPLTERIAASDASFTAVFPPCHAEGEAVVCAGEKRGGTITLTVLSPARSADVRIEADPAARTCTLFTAGCPDPIPVDPAAAEAILAPLSLLCIWEAADDPAPAFSRSDDGEETRVTSARGTLILSPDGVPVRVVTPDLCGVPRAITLEGWSFSD
ncbi:MAG: hypothetical protein J6V24_02045 [Clostridia bacterium]|nr:hypothetical protein [Clostridia bacterium]